LGLDSCNLCCSVLRKMSLYSFNINCSKFEQK
jgi:hypothetical protein